MINQTKQILEESLKKLMLSTITLKIFMIWSNGPAWKMQHVLLPAKKLTTPGLKDWYRFLMLCMKISRLY